MNDKADKTKEITLTAEQEKDFAKGMKTGVLKQLRQRQLLTDKQLQILIEMQNK